MGTWAEIATMKRRPRKRGGGVARLPERASRGSATHDRRGEERGYAASTAGLSGGSRKGANQAASSEGMVAMQTMMKNVR